MWHHLPRVNTLSRMPGYQMALFHVSKPRLWIWLFGNDLRKQQKWPKYSGSPQSSWLLALQLPRSRAEAIWRAREQMQVLSLSLPLTFSVTLHLKIIIKIFKSIPMKYVKSVIFILMKMLWIINNHYVSLQILTKEIWNSFRYG